MKIGTAVVWDGLLQLQTAHLLTTHAPQPHSAASWAPETLMMSKWLILGATVIPAKNGSKSWEVRAGTCHVLHGATQAVGVRIPAHLLHQIAQAPAQSINGDSLDLYICDLSRP